MATSIHALVATGSLLELQTLISYDKNGQSLVRFLLCGLQFLACVVLSSVMTRDLYLASPSTEYHSDAPCRSIVAISFYRLLFILQPMMAICPLLIYWCSTELLLIFLTRTRCLSRLPFDRAYVVVCSGPLSIVLLTLATCHSVAIFWITELTQYYSMMRTILLCIFSSAMNFRRRYALSRCMCVSDPSSKGNEINSGTS